MFTGIIEEVGEIVAVREQGDARVFAVRGPLVRAGLALGDSVSIDGACQTVARLLDDGFEVVSVATTLGRTTFGGFRAGRRVNLERAMPLGARLGGHMVQGHVDGVGRVEAVVARGEHVLIDFTLPGAVAEVTVLHGSIAVDGISMTVNDLPAPGVAQLSVVPFTREHTNLGERAVGDAVNVEGDVIGKYVRHLLGAPGRPGGGAGAADLREGWGY